MTRADEARTEDFEFLVRDPFTITGRGTHAVGEVMSGQVRKSDPLVLRRRGGQTRMTRALGVEHVTGFRLLPVLIGLRLEDVPRDGIGRGDLLRAPAFDARWGPAVPEATAQRRDIEAIIDVMAEETEREIVQLAKSGRRDEAVALLMAHAPLTDGQLQTFLGYYGPLMRKPGA